MNTDKPNVKNHLILSIAEVIIIFSIGIIMDAVGSYAIFYLEILNDVMKDCMVASVHSMQTCCSLKLQSTKIGIVAISFFAVVSYSFFMYYLRNILYDYLSNNVRLNLLDVVIHFAFKIIIAGTSLLSSLFMFKYITEYVYDNGLTIIASDPYDYDIICNIFLGLLIGLLHVIFLIMFVKKDIINYINIITKRA